MNSRQEQLLLCVVKSHIDTGSPVSSGKLCRDFDIRVSPATVRNDLLALEDAGYLQQPHTSAGRIPTVEGYRYYVERLQKHLQLEQQARKRLQAAAKQQQRYRETARALAELTGETVILVKDGDSVYYTGIKNLISKPEFADQAQISAVAGRLDELESRAQELAQLSREGPQVHIGRESEFGRNCTTISIKAGPEATFVVLGPTRMRYQRNISLLDEISRLL